MSILNSVLLFHPQNLFPRVHINRGLFCYCSFKANYLVFHYVTDVYAIWIIEETFEDYRYWIFEVNTDSLKNPKELWQQYVLNGTCYS